MRKKAIAWILTAVMLCTLFCGCEKQDKPTVSVQSVGLLCGIGSVGLLDRYAGVVTAGDSVPVERDEEKKIQKLLVSEGDLVEAGDLLFTYDTEAIALTLDKMKLELEQVNASIEMKNAQIEQLEKEKASARQEDQLDYTLQIQELQIDLTEAAIDVREREKDIEQTEAFLENVEVTAPVSGRIKKINENGGFDDYGEPLPYISIMEVSTYRVKGIVNEQNAQAMKVGMPVNIRSRAESDLTWSGVVDMIDWENPVQNNDYWGPSDQMTQPSKYPFYVALETDDGLMLGQHVYIEPWIGEGEEDAGFKLPAWCLNDADTEAPWVWAVDGQKHLEKRPVRLGAYDEAADAYPVLEGLTAEDYIAPPGEDCVEGAEVVFYSESDFDPPVVTRDAAFENGEPAFENGDHGFEEGGDEFSADDFGFADENEGDGDGEDFSYDGANAGDDAEEGADG